MTRTALSLSPCEILKPAFPDCQEPCDPGQTSCQPVLFDDGSTPPDTEVAPNDSGDDGATSFMSVMSIGVILLIVLLFVLNLCIAIRRYLCRPRTPRSPADWTEVPREQRSLRHVLFINPGGSFNIGERLKKESFSLDVVSGGDQPPGQQGENCPVASWVHSIEMTPQEGEDQDGFREGEVIGVRSPPVLTVATTEVDPGGQ